MWVLICAGMPVAKGSEQKCKDMIETLVSNGKGNRREWFLVMKQEEYYKLNKEDEDEQSTEDDAS